MYHTPQKYGAGFGVYSFGAYPKEDFEKHFYIFYTDNKLKAVKSVCKTKQNLNGNDVTRTIETVYTPYQKIDYCVTTDVYEKLQSIDFYNAKGKVVYRYKNPS